MTRTRVVRADTALAPPIKLPVAFDHPDRVVDLIERGAPYRTEEAVHKNLGVTHTFGWFRNFWALGGKVVFEGADDFFFNPHFIEAAKQSFGAEVIRPVAMMTNLNLPMAGFSPHLDLPFFRGAMNREVPSWMLPPMGYSGLFNDWAVPVASALTWFYDGVGGEFEYWPDGLHAPSMIERPPYSNTAVLADNEYMLHRVGPIGLTNDHVPNDGIPFEATLALTEDRRWQVQLDRNPLMSFDYVAVRLSVLWKAYCFKDEAEAAAYDDKSDDLTPDQVTATFCDELTSRGVSFQAPTDPFNDVSWKQTLLSNFPAPTIPAAIPI